MKKFLKWFIGIIIIATVATGIYMYTDWFKCDIACDNAVSEKVITDEAVANEIAEDIVEIDTMIVNTTEEVIDTIQNTSVKTVNE